MLKKKYHRNGRCRMCFETRPTVDDCDDPLRIFIGDLFSFRIQPGDPDTRICLKCLRTMHDFHEFYVLVRRNQSTLDSALCESSSPAKDEEPLKTEVAIFDENDNNDDDDDWYGDFKHESDSDVLGDDSKTVIEVPIEAPPNFTVIPKPELMEAYVKLDATVVDRAMKRKSTSEPKKTDEDGEPKRKKKKKKKTKKNLRKTDEDFDSAPKTEVNSSEEGENSAVSELPPLGANVEIFRKGEFLITMKELDKMAMSFFTFVCDECTPPKKYCSHYVLLSHFRSCHKKKKPVVTCCNKKFYDRTVLYQHMAWHFQPSEFQCPICQKQHTDYLTLKRHYKDHSRDQGVQKTAKNSKKRMQPSEFICHHCNKSYCKKGRLVQHIKNSHNEKTFKCERCSKMFGTKTFLNMHISTVHSENKCICNECGKACNTEAALKGHMLTHTNERIQCHECSMVLKHRATFVRHMKTHGPKSFKCDQCDYSAIYRSTVMEHKRISHDKIRDHVCEICCKAFAGRMKLEDHVNATHFGVHKYTCRYCPMTFGFSPSRSMHHNKVHKAEHEAYKAEELRKKLY